MKWEARTNLLHRPYVLLLADDGSPISSIHFDGGGLWRAYGQRKGFAELMDAKEALVHANARAIARTIPEVPRGTKARRWWQKIFKPLMEHR